MVIKRDLHFNRFICLRSMNYSIILECIIFSISKNKKKKGGKKEQLQWADHQSFAILELLSCVEGNLTLSSQKRRSKN